MSSDQTWIGHSRLPSASAALKQKQHRITLSTDLGLIKCITCTRTELGYGRSTSRSTSHKRQCHEEPHATSEQSEQCIRRNRICTGTLCLRLNPFAVACWTSSALTGAPSAPHVRCGRHGLSSRVRYDNLLKSHKHHPR